LVLLAALISTVPVVGRLGYGAKAMAVVSQDEADLLGRLRTLSRPDSVVLEPSILMHEWFPSPVTWVAGRSVSLTSRPAIAALAPEDARARIARIEAVFNSSDRGAALEAISQSGATWVYAPSRAPLRFRPVEPLQVALQNAAGIVYRVGPVPAPSP
jgi:hypothetical protein